MKKLLMILMLMLSGFVCAQNYYEIKLDINTKESLTNITVDNRNNRFIVRSINIMGQEVQDSYTGFIINIYNDGSTEKVYKQ